jgi:hypothetical protein
LTKLAIQAICANVAQLTSQCSKLTPSLIPGQVAPKQRVSSKLPMQTTQLGQLATKRTTELSTKRTTELSTKLTVAQLTETSTLAWESSQLLCIVTGTIAEPTQLSRKHLIARLASSKLTAKIVDAA